MSKFNGFLAFAALALGTAAHADCDRPKNDFDDLYCLDKVYIQSDKDLNDEYGKLSKQLDANGKAALKRGQLAWIKSRNEQCSMKDDHGFWVNLDCATQTTIARTQFLQDRNRECASAGCMPSKLNEAN
ncbi:MAG TPA: lysozyme inhibitor LprI family protein [Nevskia sp.]|nr:lysozyme inhibitor LprI family protein [Nevskia sp.]